jgi:hypothetical protein
MWIVITTDLFNEWLEQQDESTQEKVLAALVVLQQQGPSLGRPLVDTVYDSKFTNMKELRVQHRGKASSETMESMFSDLRSNSFLFAG